MSLNGLDAPHVQEAYNAALTESGGWFLLKYVSRDEVELLDQGQGGVTEARAALGQYEDRSPLYGLIMYRRKKVLIKYIPEGTSRLLQARTTVHLQDVLEKYSPYETVVEITSAEGLSDTTLAAAFPLHTAAPSIKGNNLDEITEDGEEPAPPTREGNSSPVPSMPSIPGRKSSTQRWPSRRSQTSTTSTAPQISVDVGKSPVLSQKSSVSRFLIREESGHQSVTPLDSPALSEYAPSEASVQDTASVMSGRSERELSREKSPTFGSSDNGDLDFEKYYAELYKPKVKLGPRPVNITERSKRASKAGIPSHSRPVSNLPVGLQIKTNPAQATLSLFPTPPSTNSPATSLPPMPYLPRPGSSGSSRSLPLSTMSARTSKSTMTPEKMRLIKAMELRKRQMRRSTPVESSGMAPVPENAPAMPSLSEQRRPSTSEIGNNKADSGVDIEYEDPLKNPSQKDQSPPEDHETHHDPLFDVSSPTLSKTSEIRGTLERSPALSSLIGEDLKPDPSPVHPLMTSSRTQGESSKESRNSAIGEDAPEVTNSNTTTRDEAEEDANKPESQIVVDEDRFEVTTPESKTRDAASQRKRRGWAGQLTINVDDTHSPGTYEHDISEDDFLDELHSATVHEATPISLSRSPASPFFPPRRPSARSAKSTYSITSAISGASLNSVVNSIQRPQSGSPKDGAQAVPPPEFLLPDAQPDQHGRSASISSVKTTDSEPGDPIAARRKNQVSSGISKRIQALAEKSLRDGSPPTISSSPRSLSENLSSLNMRKNSLKDATEPHTNKRPVSKLSVWPAPSPPRTAQPSVIVNRSANRESVSVTARIVRQPPITAGKVNPPSELHHSPLLINHTRPTPTPDFPPMAPLLTGNTTTEGQEAGLDPHNKATSPTFSHSSVDSGGAHNRKSFDRTSSKGRYRSGYESPQKGISRHTSTTSLASQDSEKSGSRTSRFFKRMSHMGSRRRSLAPAPMATVTEPSTQISAPAEKERRHSTAPHRDSVPDIPPPIVIGDLNVQFPDTLLWKRRWVEIDSSGHLIFTATRPVSSATGGGNKVRGFVTKFRLTELSEPYIPDHGDQEMPHTVLLDLVDGATLSCASEDNMAQRHLMSLLRTYHEAWNTNA
ncbi:hypothetical protein BDV97DRAFT_401515 [Delphinella strobiligena]|nr:hypothetical protein BDV97DRAFT_401515 [Delphinella strobiligena]